MGPALGACRGSSDPPECLGAAGSVGARYIDACEAAVESGCEEECTTLFLCECERFIPRGRRRLICIAAKHVDQSLSCRQVSSSTHSLEPHNSFVTTERLTRLVVISSQVHHLLMVDTGRSSVSSPGPAGPPSCMFPLLQHT